MLPQDICSSDRLEGSFDVERQKYSVAGITAIGVDEPIKQLELVDFAPVLPEYELVFAEKLCAFYKLPKPIVHQLVQEFSQRANQTDVSVGVTG